MRFFATNKSRAAVLSSTLFAFGGMTQKLNAQDGQVSSRSDIALFDSFLDAHADLDAQLRANPSLLTNEEYLEAHPQFQAFLNKHPQVQTQMRQNPSFFMDRAKRFDAREAGRRTNPNPDLTRQQVATMDQFMDKNPEIGRDLWRNPSMVNNAEYLEAHPQLQAFLNQHPNVKEEFAENPRYFMNQENGLERQEQSRGQNFDRDADNTRRDRDFDRDRNTNRSRDFDRRSNPDVTNQEVSSFDQFLDRHQDVAKSL